METVYILTDADKNGKILCVSKTRYGAIAAAKDYILYQVSYR